MSNKNQTIDQSLIRDLANLLKETDLSEIEVEQDNLRIRVARGINVQTVSTLAPVPVSAPSTQSATDSKPRDLANHPGAVPSPMVGTAYLAAAPGAKQFVSIGEMVKEGQTVLIVEAMKTMNQIAAPRSGKVTAILVDDGQPVEFGEPLLILE